MRKIFEQTIIPILSQPVADLIQKIPKTLLLQTTEIRLRVGQAIMLVLGTQDIFLSPTGLPVSYGDQAYCCTSEDVAQTLQLISKNSLYAFEQEIKMGFLTVAGGHRVGLAGQALLHDGNLKALKNISCLNIRLARQIKGCADLILPYIIAGNNSIYNTLIISPPRCGKTTLVRDLVRQLSTGVKSQNFSGVQIGLVDERSEIAACDHGVPTIDIGPRVDVLDGCPKAIGMLMLIRSMGPQVIVTDELGRSEDVEALREALNAGVKVIATVHGRDVADIKRRPYIGDLIRERYFDRYVILDNSPSIGTIQQIIGAQDGDLLYKRQEVRICG